MSHPTAGHQGATCVLRKRTGAVRERKLGERQPHAAVTMDGLHLSISRYCSCTNATSSALKRSTFSSPHFLLIQQLTVNYQQYSRLFSSKCQTKATSILVCFPPHAGIIVPPGIDFDQQGALSSLEIFLRIGIEKTADVSTGGAAN